jgi:hypothetical protein
MNTQLCASLILTLAMVVMAGCGSPTATSSLNRIDANRTLYESWPLPVQQAVLEQRVIPGMDTEMVHMALGLPDDVTTGANPRSGETEEVWIYRQGGGGGGLGGLRNTTISIGGGGGGVYVGGSRTLGGGGDPRLPAEDYVVWRDGRVIRSTLGPESPGPGATR